jgi:hypothetical protein
MRLMRRRAGGADAPASGAAPGRPRGAPLHLVRRCALACACGAALLSAGRFSRNEML